MNIRIVALLSALGVCLFISSRSSAYVYDSGMEFVANGDFNGDGLTDVVIVDKATGKYRLGYQEDGGTFRWVDHRRAGLIDATSVDVGRLLDPDHDALVFASANDNKVTVVGAGQISKAGEPRVVEVPALGPQTALALDIGGDGNTPLDDLFVGSIYNVPSENMITLMRNTGGAFTEMSNDTADAPVLLARTLKPRPDGPVLVASLLTHDGQDSIRLTSLQGGRPVTVAEASNLPPDSRYVFGSFLGHGLPDFVFYQVGATTLTVRSVEEPGKGTFRFGAGASIELDRAVEQVVPISGGAIDNLLIIHADGDGAALFGLEPNGQSSLINPVQPPVGEVISGAVPLDRGFFLLTTLVRGKPSLRYRLHTSEGTTNSPPVYGKLASLADTDDATVPAIRERILACLEVTDSTDMRPYTNTIPGSKVTYSMIPIPGGEFVMGSPEGETGHQPDEAPQHQVRISPFWMGRCEVTWNEFEIFLYADDERKLRATIPTDASVNQVSDAITRPSKPYADMTFGMGRDGFPAISMTQHAANKYCHWLSAKTGHFYRLPTEAEWEYACRAGTTTAYSFGDDPKQLGNYAWYEMNSDFKYQKVGRGKPNAWGLYDLHGNVAEWCLDQYEPGYEQWAGRVADNPWNRATNPYPHVVRGGSYDDPDVTLRSAARGKSHPAWKMRDPQLPKSVWWFTDAQTVGFRIVRPLAVPSTEELTRCWISGVEKD